MDKTKKIIVILGMHRSGTSAAAKALTCLGVDLGDDFIPPCKDNPKGFYEDIEITQLNIEMLEVIGQHWFSLSLVSESDVEKLVALGYLERAVDLLKQKITVVNVFGFKDPRLSKLLKFWKLVFARIDCDIRYVFCLRHPLSVANSLYQRNKTPIHKGYLLWLSYNLSIVSESENVTLIALDYDQLMEQPLISLQRLADELELDINIQSYILFTTEFLDQTLRHTIFDSTALKRDSACPSAVMESYPLFQRFFAGDSQIAYTELMQYYHCNAQKIISDFQLFDDVEQATIEYFYKATNARELSQQLQACIGWAKSLEKEAEERTQWARSLELQVEERTQWARSLEVQVEERTQWARSLEVQVEERTQWARSLEHELVIVRADTGRLQHEVEVTGEQIALLNVKNNELNQELQRTNERLNSQITTNSDLLHQLTELRSHFAQLINSRSWRVTRPLRFVVRSIRYGVTTEDKSKLLLVLRKVNNKFPAFLQSLNRALLGKWVRSMISRPVVMFTAESQQCLPQQLQTVEQPLAPALSAGKDFIIWGVIDWHFRHQRPQQIAQALAAEGDRVFYISSNLLMGERAGFSIEPLDKDGRLFQVHLSVNVPIIIYHNAPKTEVTKILLESIGELFLWAGVGHIINIVQHPFWFPVARQLPNSQLIYDCMDHHEGFENTGKAVLVLEQDLFRFADLTITTSTFLDEIVAKYTVRRAIIRNAGEFDYFSHVPPNIYHDSQGRKIIGYYGAIAEWFDIELVRQVSQCFPDCLLLIVGADTVNAQSQLASQNNIVFIGEVPYRELTYYLYAFDVCLLPFKVIPLILATNPVKIYEYLGAGKPVVAVDVPEIQQFGGLVRVGNNHEHFVEQVGHLLIEHANEVDIVARKTFAEQQTWHHRARDLAKAISRLPQPKVSVIVVTYNNLELTKACLHSVEAHSNYSNYEVIVIDNASSDESPDYLRQWAQQGDNRTVILNPDNKGFAAANNQGLLAATGDYLVLLNNDTYVTPGWIASLVKHIERNPKIGLLGPVTCNIGNEAKINLHYNNMSEMFVESKKFTLRHIGHLTPLRTAAFFCVMFPRTVYEQVGLLDEAFGIGFFEDDDYCRRVEQAGYSIYCADDVFIHHHLSASFNKLKIETRKKLFDENKAIYEKKWGAWIPHTYRSGVS